MWIVELRRNAECWERGAKLWTGGHADELRKRAAELREWVKALEADDVGRKTG